MNYFSIGGMLIGLSNGWKLGMIPTNAGSGIMGMSDLGLWLTGLGRSIRGGGIYCFGGRKENESSDYLNDG